MRDMNRVVGQANVLLMTLDTLRFDVARAEYDSGRTPNLRALLPAGWEARHSPASFTYAAHCAFFAGFLPTPIAPGVHPRLFAAKFPGSETTSLETWVFDAPDLVTGLRARGYHTSCVGGTGFFNLLTPLGQSLPGLFDEAVWRPELGVTDTDSTANQFAEVARILSQRPPAELQFVFINISALHQPNCFYADRDQDSIETHAAALRYVDTQLPALIQALRSRGDWFGIICSDHGTAYGEDGYRGHRVGHPVVWTVPYAEFQLQGPVCGEVAGPAQRG